MDDTSALFRIGYRPLAVTPEDAAQIVHLWHDRLPKAGSAVSPFAHQRCALFRRPPGRISSGHFMPPGRIPSGRSLYIGFVKLQYGDITNSDGLRALASGKFMGTESFTRNKTCQTLTTRTRYVYNSVGDQDKNCQVILAG